MKRWEMAALALNCDRIDARTLCDRWSEDPDDEMGLPSFPDIGRDIVDILVAHIVAYAKEDNALAAKLDHLTGREKEGE